jgi:regulator of replication initiation timing
MNCNDVKSLMEEYIMGELDKNISNDLKKHIDGCDGCRAEYDELKELIGGLKKMKESIKIKDDILELNKRNILKNTKRKKFSFRRVISGVAVGVLIITFLFTGSIVAFPTFASNYVPDQIPVIRQLKEIQNNFNEVKEEFEEVKRENDYMKQENEEIRQENEELKRTIREIEGEHITEYQTSEGIDPSDNQIIQETVIRFIKALYKGNIEIMMEMCNGEFSEKLANERTEILFSNDGNYVYLNDASVIFTQITNVAKEGDVYYVFVRLNDGINEDAADYQLNFELEKINGEFLISFVGKDA